MCDTFMHYRIPNEYFEPDSELLLIDALLDILINQTLLVANF